MAVIDRGRLVWPALVGAAALLARLPNLDLTLRYDRGAVAGGEWWRLLSGHLPHLGTGHLLLNLAGLALTWALVGHLLGVRAWGAALALIAIGIGSALYFLEPQLAWYVGLSGLLHGALALGAALQWRRTEGRLLFALLAAKLLWEAWQGPLGGFAGPVVIEAHRYGFICGLLVAPLFRPAARRA